MSDTKAITPEFEAALNRYAPHDQRVIQEYIDLGNLSIRLMEFVGSNVFRELPKEGRDLLTGQIDVMSQLQCILIDRINRFKPAEPEPAPTCANGHGECCGGCLERKADAPKAQSLPALGVPWTAIDPSNPATLPPKGDWLVTVDTDNGREVHVLWIDEDKQWWHDGEYVFAHAYYFRPIAWAPRPEAYSGPVPSEG